MELLQFSLFSIAEFLETSEARKRAIIREQMNFNFNGPFHYRSLKATMKRYILSGGNKTVLNTGIQNLKNKTPDTEWKKRDQEYSLAAAELFKNMPLPPFLEDYELETVKCDVNSFTLNDVEIIISPDLIFRIKYEGKKYLGAFKFHVAKGLKYSNRQSALVAQLVNQFLSNHVEKEDEKVIPRLCVCIDPFAQTVINASHKMKLDMNQLKLICEEIHQISSNNESLGNLGVA